MYQRFDIMHGTSLCFPFSEQAILVSYLPTARSFKGRSN